MRSSWHGPGAVADCVLADLGCKGTAPVLGPRERQEAARAYFGGRIDISRWGEARAYHYDINSAYPAALPSLPDLSRATWRKRRRITRAEVAALPVGSLVHVCWSVPRDTVWGPLPFRESDGRIVWPTAGAGTYHAVEVAAALRRFPRGLRLEWATVPTGGTAGPFATAIPDYYRARQRLKAAGDAGELGYKLALNSIYGKLTQHVGRAPYRHPIWAGYITAHCRARISDALAMADESDVLAVLTDGIYTRRPLPVHCSKRLGEWSGAERVTLRMLLPGLYATSAGGDEWDVFSRGYERGTAVDFAGIIAGWERRSDAAELTTFSFPRFVGMGLALQGGAWPRCWRRWRVVPRHILPVWLVGTSKRFGVAGPEYLMRYGKDRGDVHRLYPRDAEGVLSAPYEGALVSNLDPQLTEDQLLAEVVE